MAMMKAMAMMELGRIEPVERPAPEPEADQVLVKVKCVGICGSDVHYFHDGRIRNNIVKPPFILGHECAGEVAEVGSAVTRFKVGDRVALEPGVPCGECSFCRDGRYNLCPHVIFFATPPVDGVLKEYVVHPESMTFHLPEGMDYEQGALIEPLAVGYHAAMQGGARVGKTAAVLGSGCIGLMTMVALKSMGVDTIFATDVIEPRLAIARDLGAKTFNAAGDVVAQVLETTGGVGVDLVFECSGHPGATLQTASLVKRGGKIVLVGMSPVSEMPFDIGQILGKEASVETVFRYRNIYQMAIDAVSAGRAKLSGIVSHRYRFEDTQKACEEAVAKRSEIVKGVIEL